MTDIIKPIWKFIIYNKGKPLSFWGSNGGTSNKVKDFIEFSWNNHYIFDNKKEAQDMINFMISELRSSKRDLNTSIKIEKILSKLEIMRVLK